MYYSRSATGQLASNAAKHNLQSLKMLSPRILRVTQNQVLPAGAWHSNKQPSDVWGLAGTSIASRSDNATVVY
jgi:hypothetical protein